MTSEISNKGWLDKHFIERALAAYEDTKIKVKKIQVKSATSPGDNYGSIMYRVNTEYDKQYGDSVESCEKSIIVKAIPEDEYLKTVLTENNSFTAEMEILQNIVPSLHRLLNTSSTDKPVLLGPICYHTSHEPCLSIVMEDLCEAGFKMAPRLVDMDLNHCKLVVSRLGVLHAASIPLNSQDPKIFDNILTHIYVRNGVPMRNFVMQSFTNVAEKLQNLSEEGKRYSEILYRLSTTAYERLMKTLERDETCFNVFIHGDPWTNNMMFKYDENGEVLDLVFLDFQCSYYGSPALDLLYFLYLCPTPEIRNHHFEELLECYHSSLSKTLARLGYGHQCPSLNEIHKEMETKRFMAIFAALCVKPLTCANSDKVPDLTDLIKQEKSSHGVSNSHITDHYMDYIVALLPIFEKNGLFDLNLLNTFGIV